MSHLSSRILALNISFIY